MLQYCFVWRYHCATAHGAPPTFIWEGSTSTRDDETKGNAAMVWKTDDLGRIANLGAAFARFLLLAFLAALLWFNFTHVSQSIRRIQRLVVPGVVDITLQDIRTSKSGSGPREMKWATYYRVSEVEVVGAKLDQDENIEGEKEPKNAEWVEIRATTSHVDLAGGFIGDASELRRIPEDTPVLRVGECIRIATFGEAPVKDEYICSAAVSVETFSGDKPGGFLKKDAGEGDRIVVFDRNRRPVLDMDYWIIKPPHEKLKRQGIASSVGET